MQEALTNFLGRYLSDNRRLLIEKVLNDRTRHVTVVLEDIYQSQNGSAVIRTCECMGLQDVHVVENTSKYATNKKVLKGSNKWMDIVRHNKRHSDNLVACFEHLKTNDYRIYVTDPAGGLSIEEVPVGDKIALVMGNELRGASPAALALAHERVTIPMYGFTESLNISVSAAICLHAIMPRLRASDVQWQLAEEEKAMLRYQWYKKCLRNAELLEKEFWKRQPATP